MYNRDWLKAQIVFYLKDTSVDLHLDTWIDLGAKRVSEVLECFEMEVITNSTLVAEISQGVDGGFSGDTGLLLIDGGDAFASGVIEPDREFITLQNNFKRLVVVQALDNDTWRPLRSVPKHEAYRYNQTGVPQVYHVEQRKVYPLPRAAGSFRTITVNEVVIPVGDNEVDALTSYPFVFLNAALAEAYDWKQDAEMNARYENKWLNEAREITTRYRGEHTGDTPSMRAM